MSKKENEIYNNNINFQSKYNEYEERIKSLKDASASEKSYLEKKINELEQDNLILYNKLQECEQRFKQEKLKLYKVEAERDIYQLQLNRLQEQTTEVKKILNTKEQKEK